MRRSEWGWWNHDVVRWPASWWCDRMFIEEGLTRSLPVSNEIPKWSAIRVWMSRLVWPTYDALQHRHLKRYTTRDFRPLGILSLKEKKCARRSDGRKTKRTEIWGKACEQSLRICVRIWRLCCPVKGRQKYMIFLGVRETWHTRENFLSKKTLNTFV